MSKENNMEFGPEDEGENLIGKVCVCSIGRPGIVTGRADLGWGPTWVGMALDQSQTRTWSSRKPIVIAETLNEFWCRCMKSMGRDFPYVLDGVYVTEDKYREVISDIEAEKSA